MAARSRFSDSLAARGLALAIAAAAGALMVWLGRNDVPAIRGILSPDPVAAISAGSGNPQLDACLKSRIGDVDKMREEGVINAAQHNTFKARATAYCQTEFPPLQ